ncbi:hypothetical protein HY041_01225 [Candidatus Roizmanbacteria bacterium]|nr:hypothetical protein [Candidatus Roizmanbacteria bacterium]
MYPFLTSEKTELWHLIPVYLPMSLIIASGAYYGIKTLWHWSTKLIPTINKLHLHLIVYLVFFLSIALIQMKVFYNEVFPQSKYIPDDVDISKRTTKYKERFFLDDDYIPLASFYSGRRVFALVNQPDEQKTLLKLFQSSENDFIVVTRNWALNNLKEANIKYKVLEQNNSFTIVSRP